MLVPASELAGEKAHLLQVQHRQVRQRVRHVRVVGPMRLLIDAQGALIQRLCLVVQPLTYD